MAELPDEPPPARRRAPKTARRAQFVMPTEHHDERVGEVIEAFLDGPPLRARNTPRTRRQRPVLRSIRRPIDLDTRPDWDRALRLEDARMTRYGRSATVLVIRVRLAAPDTMDLLAGRVGKVVRQHARETDRVTRASADRFHLLLPETDEAQAEALAGRIRDACVERVGGRTGDAVEILAAAVCPDDGHSLRDALRTALATVEG